MNQATKQRLAGAIVLGCLAVIFIPILLDGEGLDSPEFELNTPSPPPLPEVSGLEPERPDFMSDSADADINAGLSGDEDEDGAPASAGQSATPSNQEPDGAGPGLDARGLPQGWSVRLGSFGDKDNADALVKRLREAGHKAYSRMVSGANGSLTAVYVGPVLSRGEADTLQEELSESFELDGLVVEFTIEE